MGGKKAEAFIRPKTTSPPRLFAALFDPHGGGDEQMKRFYRAKKVACIQPNFHFPRPGKS
jgi:hypothetical protein